MRIKVFVLSLAVIAALAFFCNLSQASSHREAQAILEDPAVDNTDVYAFVTPGSHANLNLLAGYYGLHEPGQGNQQTRLGCGVLYEFHITRGIGVLDDAVTYQIQLNCTPPPRVDTTDLSLPPGGGKELLVQIGGAQFNYSVRKIVHNGGKKTVTTLASSCKMAPPNVGPFTDRIAYGLGDFKGYDVGTEQSALYNEQFIDSFICDLAGGEGRAFVGVMDDAFYLDEKGIFDVLNLANLPGGRKSPGEDVFAGFNLNVMALEVPVEAVLGGPIPHNGTCGDDTLLGVWASASRHKSRTLRGGGDPIESGPFIQVGREGLPLVNAGLIGVQDQGKYLRTTPKTDVQNFAAYFLNPILVRDAEFLGIYRALGVDQATVDSLKSGRVDILKVINLDDIPAKGCHHVPIEPGKVGDVLRIDVATDTQFPNGRSIPGGSTNDREQVDVSDVIVSLILTGNPAAGVGDSVNHNDKPYLTKFPWYALPHQGLKGGHGKAAQ